MLRVAAYCRVSTDKDDQINSLENQKRYFDEYINKNKEWKFVDLYVDEGISGTNVKKRMGFKKMISDAEKKRFDLLLTKEISRFARNTLDSILYTRQLKSLGIGVIFMNDNINIMDADSELRLTIMASIAQEESRKISERVKWGQKRSMENKIAFGNRIYGYNIKNGKLSVNPEEAEIVRTIFKLYKEGMGTHILAKELKSKGILTPTGSRNWTNATILRILKNEKYIGILKQRKQITTDFLNHTRKRNEGEEEYIIFENNHEPIIDRNIFDSTQYEIQRRMTFQFSKTKYSNRYPWSGKLECANCGSKYKRTVWHKGKSFEKVVWRCTENIRNGIEKVDAQGMKEGCAAKAIEEIVLQKAFLELLQDIVKDKEAILNDLEKIIIKVMEEAKNTSCLKNLNENIDKIDLRKDKLVDLYTDGVISKDEFKKRNDQLNNQLEELNNKIEIAEVEREKFKDERKVFEKIREIIRKLGSAQEFSEGICKELFKKVIIYDRNHFKIILKNAQEKEFFFDAAAVLTNQQSRLQKVQFR